MKIVIPGGSGHLGTILAREFHAEHEVVVLSRHPQSRPWRTVLWDGTTAGPWTEEIEGSDVVINLAGRSVNCRYTKAHRNEILESRIASTKAVGRAIASVRRPPFLWMQASSATIYSHRFDAPNDEEHGVLGGTEADAPETWRFSIEVAKEWERAMDEVRTPKTRRVKMRTGIVMSPETGGPFDTLLRLTRIGIGGRAGDGRQFMSWIHHHDFVRAIEFIIARPFLQDEINITAPAPLPNGEFVCALARAWGARIEMPANRWLLEAGAAMLGTETELILKSRRVVPSRLVRYGFRFEYPEWPDAARALCNEWRALHGRASMAREKVASW